jgi:CheY-like chemotaxis protein
MSKTTCILIAEDNQELAVTIQQDLLRYGYEVPLLAYTPMDALEKAMILKPDLILMDINFNGQEQDGIEIAKIIQEKLDIPIIFLTGYSDESTFQRAKDIGPYNYILKPIEHHELRLAVEISLKNKLIEREFKKRQRLISKAYIDGQDQERSRLEELLHEDLGVSLSSILYYFSMLSDRIQTQEDKTTNDLLGESLKLIHSTIDLLRDICFDLAPNVLNSFGLLPAIQTFTQKIRTRHKYKITIRVVNKEALKNLNRNLERGIYWSCFELLRDAYKYYNNSAIIFNLSTANIIEVKLISKLKKDSSGKQVAETIDALSLNSAIARIKILNGKLFTNNKNPNISAYKIVIPYSNSITP